MNQKIILTVILIIFLIPEPGYTQRSKHKENFQINVVTGSSKKETVRKEDGKFFVKEFTRDEIPIMEGTYKLLNPEIRDGKFIFYSTEGEIYTAGYYENNVPAGVWNIYNTEGEVVKQINYNTIHRHSDTLNCNIAATQVDSFIVEKNDFPGNSEELPEEPTFIIVEEMPTFMGGNQDKFRTYIQQQLVYPAYCAQRMIQGKVFVSFVVNKEGHIENPHIVRGTQTDLDWEVLRVVSQAPDWTPGRQRGKVVNVQFTFPVGFMMQ